MDSNRTVGLVWLVLACACGPTAPDTGGSPGPGPGPDDVDAGQNPGPAVDAGNCGAQQEEIELINLGDPPDMLIVLDRSGSMTTGPGLFPLPGAPTKWDIMKSALTELTDAREDNIRFGLSTFPTGDTDACAVASGAEVLPDLSNANAIQTWLGNTEPFGNTPAQFALAEALTTYQGLPANSEGQFVLFATDGVPNCGGGVAENDSGDDTVAAVAALRSAGYDTFVLGFGNSFFLDTGILNDAAVAGGRPRSGSTKYYDAEDGASLSEALNEIAGGIITPSCSYALASAPPDPTLVTVLADGTPVPQSPSHQDGWDYHPDATTITFFGSFCQDIESGATTAVDFVFGCPGPVVD